MSLRVLGATGRPASAMVTVGALIPAARARSARLQPRQAISRMSRSVLIGTLIVGS